MSEMMLMFWIIGQGLFFKGYTYAYRYPTDLETIQVADGGYVTVSRETGSGSNQNRIHVKKTDPSGNHLWAKAIYPPDPDTMAAEHPHVVASPDGGVLIAADLRTPSTSHYRTLLIKMDASGNISWNKVFHYTGTYAFKHFPDGLVCTSDGGYIVFLRSTAGYTRYVLKVDSSGNLEWSKALDFTHDGDITYTYFYGFSATSDNGIVACGLASAFMYPYPLRSDECFVLKIDSLGNPDWFALMPLDSNRSTDSRLMSIAQTTDGGYVAIGENDSLGHYIPWFFKLDSLGNLMWCERFPINSSTNGLGRGNVVSYPDNGFVVRYDNGNSCLVRFDSLGQPVEGRLDNIMLASYHLSLSSGGFVVTGRGNGDYDVDLLVLGRDLDYPGCINSFTPSVGEYSTCPWFNFDTLFDVAATSETPQTSTTSLSVHNRSITVSDRCSPVYGGNNEDLVDRSEVQFHTNGKILTLYLPSNKDIQLALYDLTGRMLKVLYRGELSAGKHAFNTEIGTRGVYIAVLEIENKNMMLKFIK